MVNLPQVSVLIPAKNASATLHIAIEDASKQVDVDWQIIIANDNSTDDTLAVIEEYQKYIDKIEVIHVPSPGGIVAGRNLLLAAVKTPYLAWLDADDGWCRPDKLARQIVFLEKNKYTALVGDGKVKGVFLENLKQQNFRFPLLNEDIQARLVFKNAFIMSSIVARTDMVQSIVFKEEMEYLEDYVWVKEIANKYAVANMALGGTLHFISTPNQQADKDQKYQVYEKEMQLLQTALRGVEIDMDDEKAALLAYFVRRNKKLTTAEFKTLKTMIKEIKLALVAKGFNQESLNGFFFDVKLRMWKCKWF